MNKVIACLALMIGLTGPLYADDIDVFTGGSGQNGRPNVLLIIDNSSNWSGTLARNVTKFDAEVTAINAVLDKLALEIPGGQNNETYGDRINLGLMMFAESGDNGAYVRFAIRNMNGPNRAAFRALVNAWVRNGSGTDNSGSNQPYGKAMFEAFKYFGGFTSPSHAHDNVGGTPTDSTHFGQTAFAGGNSNDSGSYRRDYAANDVASRRAARIYYASGAEYASAGSPAFASPGANDYISPITDGCARNFVIFISNGSISVGGDSGSTTATDLLRHVNDGSVSQVTNPRTGAVINANTADEWARFLFRTDVSSLAGQQNVMTYTLAAFDPSKESQTSIQDQISLAISMAVQGNGKYFKATSSEEAVNALLTIFDEIQSVNSTFVTASLPVNTNAQGEFQNQVFIGMFRPETNATPRWWGNLKQYKLAVDSVTGTVGIVDAQSQQISKSGSGFVAPTAQSVWTTRGETIWANGFWANNPQGSGGAYDLPDGEVVEKGGAAQLLRVDYQTSQASRKVLTCPVAGCVAGSSLMAFTSGNLSSVSSSFGLPASGGPSFSEFIEWIRGKDNKSPSDEKGPGSPTTVRPSIHGDIVHSRPVAVDYGGATGVVVFYGGNDGMLRAVKGNPTSTGGHEMWSFIPSEFYGKFKRLYDNSPVLKMPATTAEGAAPKDYFWDGPITAYQNKSTGKTYLYIGARRGGKILYALDVSDIETPTVLWKIDPGISSPSYSALGQTWSAPAVAAIEGYSKPVLMFGGGYAGGYDAASSYAPLCEDATPAGTTGCAYAYGVYLVDAADGSLVKFISQNTAATLAMTKSVPSDIYPMDSDFDGKVDRLYVGDVGGNLWRIDLGAPSSGSIPRHELYKLASIGDDKKFFFRPSVLQQATNTLVTVGSGDREKPLATDTVDWFIAVKDTATGKFPASITTMGLGDLQCIANGSLACSGAVANTYGWKLPLEPGEKVINAPRLSFGGMNFSTNKPKTERDPGVCSDLGLSRSYLVKANDSITTPTSNYAVLPPDVAFSPTPFVGIVEIDGVKVPICIGCGPCVGPSCTPCVGPTCVQTQAINVPAVRSKKFWYKKGLN